MADFEFYTATYMGSAISEKAFPALEARARDQLEKLKRCCRVSAQGEVAEKMALCAMAEVLLAWDKNRGVQSASVGGVSVRYESRRDMDRALLQAARTYLDIYRGVQ